MNSIPETLNSSFSTNLLGSTALFSSTRVISQMLRFNPRVSGHLLETSSGPQIPSGQLCPLRLKAIADTDPHLWRIRCFTIM
jgi:hypothetical protein